jgi:serine/threonine protein kinase
MIFENIVFKSKIGNGVYGEVYLGLDIISKKDFAIKKISKSKLLNPENEYCFNNEVSILKYLQPHPNLIKFHLIYESISNFYIIEEYCNGGNLEQNLIKYIKKNNKPFTEEISKYIIKNILYGLSNLNSQNIIHRDLKVENILLHFDNEEDLINQNLMNSKIKIIDFGFAKFLKKNEFADSIIGTPLFMDPIILNSMNDKKENDKNMYDKKVDMWSLGIISYYILLGNLPFQGNNINELSKSIEERKFILPKNQNIYLSKNCIEFIDKLLNVDINLRPSADEILLNDNWINDKSDQFIMLKLKKENDVNNKEFINYWEKYEVEKKYKYTKNLTSKFNNTNKIDSLLNRIFNDNVIKKKLNKQKSHEIQYHILETENDIVSYLSGFEKKKEYKIEEDAKNKLSMLLENK